MKKVIFVTVIVIIALMLVACQSGDIKDAKKLNIVTSFYPMYIATSNIIDGIDDIELTNMTKPEVGCLHDYQLTTKDMNLLERADVFVINGGGMESFLEKAISNYPELNIINSSDGILEMHEQEVHSHKNGEHSHEENAHIWVSISMYMEQVKNIANSLGEIDKENKDKYLSNADTYIQKLKELKTEMHNELDNIEKENIVTFHEAFEFFAEEFGLNVVAVIEREPGTSPSAGELAKIIEIIKNTDASAIFVEPQYDASIADVISKETGKPVYSLDPVVTGDLQKDAYEKIMRDNLKVLKGALK